jgi:inner membrane protein
MNTENTTSLITRFSNWLKESVMVKIVSIAFLILFLLIPQSWVSSIMDERQGRVNEVIAEVSGKWSGTQEVTGPVLVLPFKKNTITQVTTADKRVEDRIITTIEEAYFLPEQLNIKSVLDPQTLHRGIFDVVVYNSSINVSGHFEKPNLQALDIHPENVMWKDAYLIVGLSDLRGIGENPSLTFNEIKYETEPTDKAATASIFTKNIASKVKIAGADSICNFNMQISLKGSSHLYFFPMGKSTKVEISGAWGNPSFDGAYLPETRTVETDKFVATWKVLNFNRPFPQQSIGAPNNIQQTAFGVNLIMPVDQYQKSIRTAKYGILIILLTFVSLLLIELIVKVYIHPFQYTLIGAALIIYYTLLLSFSEHIGFNLAYLVSSISIIILISLYSMTFLKKRSMSVLLSGLLTVFYIYIFIITQQQDYALLLGSLGLFLIISVLMFVSRKIDWNGTKADQGSSLE